jgi:hypothetical protein
MKTDTPETDAVQNAPRVNINEELARLYSCARKLERERDAARAECAWRPIETAPKDGTPVDLWRPDGHEGGERLANYKRVERTPTNVFYDPVYAGIVCVRDATHWKPIPTAPKP